MSTPVFDRMIRFPQSGEVTSFVEYMTSAYQEIRNMMKKGLDERRKTMKHKEFQ